MRDHPAAFGAKLPAQGDADAVGHRIAGGQYADPLALEFSQLGYRRMQRIVPGQTRTLIIAQHGQMPVAADHDFRPADGGTGGFA